MMLFWVLASCRYAVSVSGPEMDTVCFSETLASTDWSARRQSPEQHQLRNMLKWSHGCRELYNLIAQFHEIGKLFEFY
jgi:hypothetical protein